MVFWGHDMPSSGESRPEFPVLQQGGHSHAFISCGPQGISPSLMSLVGLLAVLILTPVYRLMHLFGETIGVLLKTCYTSSIKLEEMQGNADHPLTSVA